MSQHKHRWELAQQHFHGTLVIAEEHDCAECPAVRQSKVEGQDCPNCPTTPRQVAS